MYCEFCLLVDKERNTTSRNDYPDYGSLINTTTQIYQAGNIQILLRSYSLKTGIKNSQVLLLLGNAIYREVLYDNIQDVISNNIDINDFIYRSKGSFLL